MLFCFGIGRDGLHTSHFTLAIALDVKLFVLSNKIEIEKKVMETKSYYYQDLANPNQDTSVLDFGYCF